MSVKQVIINNKDKIYVNNRLIEECIEEMNEEMK
jgi:hypothetical protein